MIMLLIILINHLSLLTLLNLAINTNYLYYQQGLHILFMIMKVMDQLLVFIIFLNNYILGGGHDLNFGASPTNA